MAIAASAAEAAGNRLTQATIDDDDVEITNEACMCEDCRRRMGPTVVEDGSEEESHDRAKTGDGIRPDNDLFGSQDSLGSKDSASSKLACVAPIANALRAGQKKVTLAMKEQMKRPVAAKTVAKKVAQLATRSTGHAKAKAAPRGSSDKPLNATLTLPISVHRRNENADKSANAMIYLQEATKT